MGNASFDVDFDFVDAVLTVAKYRISMFEPVWTPLHGYEVQAWENPLANSTILPDGFWNPTKSYMALYLAFSSLLNGNISTSLTNSFVQYPPDGVQVAFDGQATIYDGSSKILQHGLSACDDIVANFVSRPFFF